MFQKIPRNLNFNLFYEILLVFYEIFLLNCYKTTEQSLREKCSYSGLFWSVFSRVRISSYSVRMWENADQNNSEYGHFLRSELLGISSEGNISTLVVIINFLSLITVQFNYFLFSFSFFFMSKLTCNYCEQGQGYKKTLNNP